MGFYKTAFLGFLIPLILTLAMMTYIIYNTNKSQEYPPTISSCPDFYSLNHEGHCVIESDVYTSNKDTCKLLNSKGMKQREKKNWAVDCGVSWDGITNNSSI